MLTKICVGLALAMAPAGLVAQSLADTHEAVSVPGKNVVAMRPIAQRAPAVAKCHPDATKAIPCEAHLRAQEQLALARADKAETKQLVER